MASEAARRPVVVIATYDERANVERLLPEVFSYLPEARVVVVDDASPDGTGDAIEAMAPRWPGRVSLLRRAGKLGYGSAFVEGLTHALALEPDCIVSMDADLSHDPAALPELVGALAAADVAIGSRYVGGVRILNWSLARLLLSVGANRYVRTILRLPIVDCTSGYRAYRRAVLEQVDLTSLTSGGYSFLVELLFIAKRRGFRITEVPIVYEDRQHGRSKMNRRVMWEAAWRPWAFLLRRR